MKNKYFILFLLLSVTIVSCCNKKHLSVPNNDIDFRNLTEFTIDGIKLDFDVIGIKDICICDSLLLFNTTDATGYLKIFSLNNLKELASICTEGRAANEFISPTLLSKQYYHRDGDVILPMIDNKAFIKELNITQSLLKKRSVIGGKGDNINAYLGTSLIVNNNLSERFEYYYSNRDNQAIEDSKYTPPYYYVTNGDEKTKIDVFKRIMDSDVESFASVCYSSGLIKHPSQNIIVQYFTYLDYLIYFDLDKKNTFSVHQMGSISFDSFLSSKANGGKTIYNFCAADCTSDFIIFLYGANDMTINSDNYNNSPFDILLFDWKGNYLAGGHLCDVVHDIAYDRIHKKLYGINRRDDIIYQFDLTEIVRYLETIVR